MRNLDFTSWQGLLSTIVGLALVTLIGIGIRLLLMFTIQQRRERANRQINERLRVLIAAYKTLGGSFTGNLTVDPTHLKDLRRSAPENATDSETIDVGSDRSSRVRDAVEAALSDIFLLGTEEHVMLAQKAAMELTGGQVVHTHELVVSLRAFIREALDLDPIPANVPIPMQGPTRPSSSSGRGKADGGKDESRQGGGGGRGQGGGQSGGMGAGMGMGIGLGATRLDEDEIDGPSGQSRQ